MAVVRLRAPLSELAGGTRHAVPGESVCTVLAALERERPALTGWILDERGNVRRHVNIYVNGQLVRGDATVGTDDLLQVLPAITGG